MVLILLDTPLWYQYLMFLLSHPLGWAILASGVCAGFAIGYYRSVLSVRSGVVLGILAAVITPIALEPWLPDLYQSGHHWVSPALSAALTLVFCLVWPWVKRVGARVLRLSSS